jgi:hypothetical protein
MKSRSEGGYRFFFAFNDTDEAAWALFSSSD